MGLSFSARARARHGCLHNGSLLVVLALLLFSCQCYFPYDSSASATDAAEGRLEEFRHQDAACSSDECGGVSTPSAVGGGSPLGGFAETVAAAAAAAAAKCVSQGGPMTVQLLPDSKGRNAVQGGGLALARLLEPAVSILGCSLLANVEARGGSPQGARCQGRARDSSAPQAPADARFTCNCTCTCSSRSQALTNHGSCLVQHLLYGWDDGDMVEEPQREAMTVDTGPSGSSFRLASAHLPASEASGGGGLLGAVGEEAGSAGPGTTATPAAAGGAPVRDLPVSLDEYKRSMAGQHQQQQQQVGGFNKTGLAAAAAAAAVAGSSREPGVLARQRMEGGGRYNYAAASHGAKVVATNKEAKGGNAVLDDDKDKYWRTPCSAEDKFLVVELSEVLTRVDTVVLGNYEFYSSQVKEFELLGSRAYPTQHWTVLGRFNATNARGPQVFDVGAEPEHLLRYVKLQMLSSHGSEFFCTLTLVRVLGIDELEALREEMEALTLDEPPLPLPEAVAAPLPLLQVAPSPAFGAGLVEEQASPPGAAVADQQAIAATISASAAAGDWEQQAGDSAAGPSGMLLDPSHSSGQFSSPPSPSDAGTSHPPPPAAAEADSMRLSSPSLIPLSSSVDADVVPGLWPGREGASGFEVLGRLGDSSAVARTTGGGKLAEEEAGSPGASSTPSPTEASGEQPESTSGRASEGAVPASVGLPRSGGGDSSILKTLMHKLRSLEVTQLLLDRYVDNLTKKYLAAVADIDVALKLLQERINDSSHATIALADRLKTSDERSEAHVAAARQEMGRHLEQMDEQLAALRFEVMQLGTHVMVAWVIAALGLLLASLLWCRPVREAQTPLHSQLLSTAVVMESMGTGFHQLSIRGYSRSIVWLVFTSLGSVLIGVLCSNVPN